MRDLDILGDKGKCGPDRFLLYKVVFLPHIGLTWVKRLV